MEHVCTCAGGCGGDQSRNQGVTRRRVLAGTAVVSAGLVLGACSSEDSGTSATPTSGGSGPSASSGSPDGSERLVGVDDFPVGGGAVVASSVGPVVVTHPSDDVFLAFNAKCPHQGCTVREVLENTILCPCHGSVFDSGTGERLEGPAPTGLRPVAVRVDAGAVYLA